MASAAASIAQLAPLGNLSRDLQTIRKLPMLEPDEECMVAKRWRDDALERPAATTESAASQLARSVRWAGPSKRTRPNWRSSGITLDARGDKTTAAALDLFHGS